MNNYKEIEKRLNNQMVELLKANNGEIVFIHPIESQLTYFNEIRKAKVLSIRLENYDTIIVHTIDREGSTYSPFVMLGNDEMQSILEQCTPNNIKGVRSPAIKLNKTSVRVKDIKRTRKVLIDNGIEEDEVDCVLQTIGYTLLDTELYPYPACDEIVR